MALSWKTSGIANEATVCWHPIRVAPPNGSQTCVQRMPDGSLREQNGRTFMFIFLTLAVGPLDAKRPEKFFDRVHAWERVFGATCRNTDGTPRYTTFDDVKAHVGLWTNASKVSDAEFSKKIMRGLYEQAVGARS